MTQFSPQFLSELSQNIKEWGKELGFQQVGISNCDVSQHEKYLSQWVENGFHGNMEFFERNHEKRVDPKKLVPGTLRIISVRMNYLPPDASFARDLKDTHIGYISRYALGRDYHKVLRKRLKKLGEKIQASFAGTSFRPFVDSAPVLEHAIAEKAGIGWTGKHSLTLNKESGSWFFLGELFINMPLPTDTPATDNCGSCTACITICPTKAIVAPYVVDANKCISYLTIEHDGAIPEELRPLMGNRIYGCDDCQLICPWNRFAQITEEKDFFARNTLKGNDLISLFEWDEATFLANTEGSPIRRIGFEKWQRNLAVAIGNCNTTDNDPVDTHILSSLKKALPTATSLVKQHILWAIKRHELRASSEKDTESFDIKVNFQTESDKQVTRVKERLVRSVEKGLKRDA